MFQKRKGKSSPPPTVRRLAGQSLRERSQQLLDDHLIPIVFGPMMLWMLVLGVWIGTASKSPSLRFWICSGVVATGAAVIAFLRLIPKNRALIRGERGELLVAEQLEELRGDGFQCFHDIVRDGFNIDHVVVGPAGVYPVETKYRSGSGVIEFRNGQGIFVDGREEERDPLKQARGNAMAVHKLIREHAGLEVFVKPLVVRPGSSFNHSQTSGGPPLW